MRRKRRIIRIERLFHREMRFLFVRLPLLPWKLRRYLLATLLVVTVTCAIRYWWTGRQIQQRLNDIAARGEPITPQQLAEIYELPNDVDDITNELLEILARIEEIKKNISEKDERNVYQVLLVWDKPDALVPQHYAPLPNNDWRFLDVAEDYLSQFQVELLALDELLATEGAMRFPVDFSLKGWPDRPEFEQMSEASELYRLRAFVHAHRGDMHKCGEAIRTLFRLSHSLRFEPTEQAQLSRFLLLNHVCRTLESLSGTVDFLDSDLLEFQRDLPCDEFVENYYRARLGERVISLVNLQEPFEEDALKILWRRFLSVTVFPHCEKQMYLDIEEASLAFVRDMTGSGKTEKRLEQLASAAEQSLAYRWARTSDVVSNATLTGWLTSRVRAIFTRLLIGKVVISIERFRQAKGEWPKTLNELVPEFLAELPQDPFSGDSIRYVCGEGEYRVYSVSLDGTDNQGQMSDDRRQSDISSLTYPIEWVLGNESERERAEKLLSEFRWGSFPYIFQITVDSKQFDGERVIIKGETGGLPPGTQVVIGIASLRQLTEGELGKRILILAFDFGNERKQIPIDYLPTKPAASLSGFASIMKDGRFEFPIPERLETGWYSVEVAVDSGLSNWDRENLGSIWNGLVLSPPDNSATLPKGTIFGVGGKRASSNGRYSIVLPACRVKGRAFRCAYGRSVRHERTYQFNGGKVHIAWADFDEAYLSDQRVEQTLLDAIARYGSAKQTKKSRVLGHDAVLLNLVTEQPDAVRSDPLPNSPASPKTKPQRIRAVAFLSGKRVYSVCVHLDNVNDVNTSRQIIESFRLELNRERVE